MALRQLSSTLSTYAWGRTLSWTSQVNISQTAVSSVLSAKACLHSSAVQQQMYSEEEMQNRSKFLATQFHGSESEMQHFMSRNQQLVTMGEEKFYRMTQLLAQHGVSKKDLLIYPNVYRRKYETVANRMRQLEEAGIKPITLRMVNTTYKKYQVKLGRLILDTEAIEMFNNNMELLTRQLGFTEWEANQLMTESLWLSNTKLSTLKEKIDLLWSYGVSSQAIRERVWVLAFPTSTIKNRLETLIQSGIHFQDFPRQYLTAIKSSEDKFRKFLERLVMDKAILDERGCSNKSEYIRSRLSCSEADLQVMCQKFPQLLTIRLPKLKIILDILLEEFIVEPSLIIESPRALRLSTETLRERLEQLRDLGLPVTGRILNLTNRDYQRSVVSAQSP